MNWITLVRFKTSYTVFLLHHRGAAVLQECLLRSYYVWQARIVLHM